MVFQSRQPPLRSVRVSWRTGCPHWEEWVAPNSPNLNPLDCNVWGPMLENTINSSQSLRRLMSSKSPCRPSRKSCNKNTSTTWCRYDRRRTSSAWLPIDGCGCQEWSLGASAVTLSISKSAATNRQRLEMGSYLGWNSIICHFYIYEYFNQTRWWSVISTHCWNISKEQRVTFMFTLQSWL